MMRLLLNYIVFSLVLTVSAQVPVDEAVNKQNQLKVDAVFRDAYGDEFMIPYNAVGSIHGCRIKVKGKKINTTMAARPQFLSLFLGKKHRRYVIVYNTNEEFKGVLLSDVPEEARIGLFAHELMHIKDYHERRFMGVVQRGVQYLSQNGKRIMEHETDSLTIAAGFGKELYQWASYVLHDSHACDVYKEWKSVTYMQPSQILECIEP